ncbi:MAG TPA: hypothetical protein VMT60_02050 [Candidatus Bathyarchaeia archaeon]|nr:hypothetical protein [Candidatus Bathyarchaeia archaeon]
MGESIFEVTARRVVGFVGGTASQISAINKKYATPHIKTTPLVRVALLLLRLYLLFLVGILIFKFITLVR